MLMGIWDGPSSTAKFVTKSLVLGALGEKTMLSPTNLHLLDFSGTRNTASNLDGLQAFLHTCMAWDFESRTGLGLEREPPRARYKLFQPKLCVKSLEVHFFSPVSSFNSIQCACLNIWADVTVPIRKPSRFRPTAGQQTSGFKLKTGNEKPLIPS